MRSGPLPIAISAVLAAIAFAQSQSPIQLEPEKTSNRNLANGASDLFALDLKADQIVQLKLEGEGKDVILSVYSPDGRLSRAFSSERQRETRCNSSPHSRAGGPLKLLPARETLRPLTASPI